MAIREARYDRVTDWYAGFARNWAAEARPLLPSDLSGQRVLEMACGLGELSRLLAARGASVTAVDLSTNMLGQATNEEAERPLGIRYLVGDVTTTDWWNGVAFDGVVCNMALMDVDDLDAAMATAARVLNPGGWFSFSLFHPCFPGLREGASEQLPSWPPDGGYSSEGWWTTHGDGVRVGLALTTGCCPPTSTPLCVPASSLWSSVSPQHSFRGSSSFVADEVRALVEASAGHPYSRPAKRDT